MIAVYWYSMFVGAIKLVRGAKHGAIVVTADMSLCWVYVLDTVVYSKLFIVLAVLVFWQVVVKAGGGGLESSS